MNTNMDRRGFLKALLVLAGSVMAPGLISAGPRESVYVPKVKAYPGLAEFLIRQKNEQCEETLRQGFMWQPDLRAAFARNLALSKRMRYATIAESKMLLFAKEGTYQL